MKKNKEEALRWLEQAEYDLGSARKNYEQKIYAYTCFIAEQCAQKAVKAFLYFKGERYIWEHSIKKLLKKCEEYNKQFTKFLDIGAILDKYYLTTRYPNTIAPPGVPYDSFTKKEAEEAVRYAEKIFGFVKKFLSEEE